MDVKVTLKGGPEGLPETVLVREGQRRLKIPFRAGYEHFEPVDERDTGDNAVFVWCDRTKLAE